VFLAARIVENTSCYLRASVYSLHMTKAMFETVVNVTAKHLELSPIRVVWGDTCRAEAFTDEGYITMPKWILTKSETIATYMAVHEVTHFCEGGIHHGKKFRKYEDAALKFWGISITRNGPYPVDIRKI